MRLTLIPLLLATPAFADNCTIPEGPPQVMEHAILMIEDNAGDGDLSVQGYFGDESWTALCLFDPAGNLIMQVRPSGTLAAKGLASINMETTERQYAQYDYAALQAEFPEGDYTVRAMDIDGEVVTSTAHFTTLLPAMPIITTPATVPESVGATVPKVPLADLAVAWQPVTTSQDGRPIAVRGYAVWVNKENHVDDNGYSRPNLDVHLGPDATSFVVPAEFLDAGSLYELEVTVIDDSGNQTVGGASFFQTE
jgi:hypothetical protein